MPPTIKNSKTSCARVRVRVGDGASGARGSTSERSGSVVSDAQPPQGSGEGGGACTTVVGFAMSFALKPMPIEMPSHATFGTFVPSFKMSCACSSCSAMPSNAAPQSETEICPAAFWNAAMNSCVSMTPAIVPFMASA